MIVMERKPDLGIRAERQIELVVDRKGILFNDLSEEQVEIQITVQNRGEEFSQPATMRVESAPLGAFVPWRPLAQLLVPSLEPGESRDFRIEATRGRPVPLGDFNRVPPKKLLTAVNSPEQIPQRSGAGLGILNLFRKLRKNQASSSDLRGRAVLAPDISDLLGRGQQHWAGNINVFVNKHSVERHLARALRVYPGRTNLAMFIVGSPSQPDAFTFELIGLASNWEAALYDLTNGRNLLERPDEPIEETQWVSSEKGLMVMLAAHPPVDCEAGSVEVHVTRQSDLKTAIVEFDLDPAAQGTGCYHL